MGKMKNISLFPEIGHTVSRGQRITLRQAKILNADDTVVSWARLNPFIRDSRLSQASAKLLMTLEINTPEPRAEILTRLSNYLVKVNVETVKAKVDKVLARKGIN
jgi:hypothetical protein